MENKLTTVKSRKQQELIEIGTSVSSSFSFVFLKFTSPYLFDQKSKSGLNMVPMTTEHVLRM